MTSQINSVLNLVANLMMLIGGYLFYLHYITKEMKPHIYFIMRLATASLITGAFSRVLFDLNIIYTGVTRDFDIIEAVIALTRNFGLGAILIYLTLKFKQ
jgi:hypothetical protein